MNHVTLFKRKAKDVTMSDSFEFARPDIYDETRELWGEGADYTLPDGYTVGVNIYEEPMIFDPRNRGCDIIVHSSGRPQLVSAMPNLPVLKRV